MPIFERKIFTKYCLAWIILQLIKNTTYYNTRNGW